MNKKKTQKIFKEWALDFKATMNLEQYHHWLALSKKQSFTVLEIVVISCECRKKIKTHIEIEEVVNLLCKSQKAEILSASSDIADEAKFVIRYMDLLINKK